MTEPPEEIRNVLHSQLSIARHYGGIRVNGTYYVYDPERCVLIREDVVERRKADQKRRERESREARQRASDKQGRLPL